jgi:hypothetical protein
VDPGAPVATFRRARALTLAVLVGTVLLTGLCAWRLVGAPEAGVAAGGLLLLHSTFVERGMEVRPDGYLAFTLAGALACEVLVASRHRRHVAQALALAAGFLFTQKAVFVCGAFGLLWLGRALRERRSGLVLLPTLTWSLPVVAVGLHLWWSGSLEAYLRYNVFNQAQVVARQVAVDQTFPPTSFLRSEGSRNVVFVVLALAGLVEAARRWLARELEPPRAAAALAAVFGLVSLWTVPAPFPYFHVTVLPPLAVLGGAWVGGLLRRLPASPIPVAPSALLLLCLGLASATSLPRVWTQTARTNGYQFRTLEEVQRITGPDDRVFDMAGLYFRPDAHPVYLMTGMMFSRYRAGGFPPIVPTLRANGVVALVWNYRMTWLSAEEQDFLSERFVHHGLNLFVLGTRVDGLVPGERRVFEALSGERFRYEGDGVLRVDGKPFAAGTLARGEHVLEAAEPIAAGRLVLDVPAPASTFPPTHLYVPFD